jgi:hypothetical protein
MTEEMIFKKFIFLLILHYDEFQLNLSKQFDLFFFAFNHFAAYAYCVI